MTIRTLSDDEEPGRFPLLPRPLMERLETPATSVRTPNPTEGSSRRYSPAYLEGVAVRGGQKRTRRRIGPLAAAFAAGVLSLTLVVFMGRLLLSSTDGDAGENGLNAVPIIDSSDSMSTEIASLAAAMAEIEKNQATIMAQLEQLNQKITRSDDIGSNETTASEGGPVIPSGSPTPLPDGGLPVE